MSWPAACLGTGRSYTTALHFGYVKACQRPNDLKKRQHDSSIISTKHPIQPLLWVTTGRSEKTILRAICAEVVQNYRFIPFIELVENIHDKWSSPGGAILRHDQTPPTSLTEMSFMSQKVSVYSATYTHLSSSYSRMLANVVNICLISSICINIIKLQ